MKFSQAALTRFYANIFKTTNCWLWGGKPDVYGYGRIYIDGTKHKAHRFSWIVANNSPIPQNMQILHDCPGGDNPLCVNPKHLRLGTNADNMRDRKRKGRYATGNAHPLRKNPEKAARGEEHAKTSFTNKDIIEIRKMYDTGKYSHPQLGKMFKCSHSTIGRIVNRKVWAHI